MLGLFLIASLVGSAAGQFPSSFEFSHTPVRGDNFQSHNQKIVYTANGLFCSGQTQTGSTREIVARSTDGGVTWSTIWDAGFDNRPANLEADEDANLYVIYPEPANRRTRFLKFSPSNDYASPVVNRTHGQAHSASKFASAYDPTRQRLYHATQWGYVFTFDRSGNFVRGQNVFATGSTGSRPSYPHLFVDESGIVHYAMTVADAGDDIPYETIRYLKSLDGGQTWKAMDGTDVSIPTTSNPNGSSTMINLPGEENYQTWLAAMHVKNGKAHFAYRTRNPADRAGAGNPPLITEHTHYMRFDVATGVREIDSSPSGEGWWGSTLGVTDYSASFASDPNDPEGPLYAVGKQGSRLIALVSDDNGGTWRDYARSGSYGLVANPGLARTLTPDGAIIGTVATSDPQWATVNFFTVEGINEQPEVSAGPDQSVTLSGGEATVNLSAAVTDDGLPSDPGEVTVAWSVVSGPGGTAFGDVQSAVTTVSFNRVGEYVLEISASDGELRDSDTLLVNVDGRESLPAHSLPPDLPSGSYSTENAFPGLQFADPVALVTPPGETNRLFVVEQIGRIAVIPDLENPSKQIFLDIQSRVRASGNEEGLLGLAFHPNYHAAGQPGFGEFFVFYQTNVASQRHWRLSKFSVSAGDPNTADAGSEVPLITQRDQAGNHNGGDLHFGDDGYLYLSVGDEGGANDQYDNGQHIDKDYFAAIFRLDVDSRSENLAPNAHPSVHAGTYRVPADNPFVGATRFNGSSVNASDVRTEIWAIGLRNPWRMSFDRPTGRLFVADVGQGAREEINVLGAATFAGNGGVPNYGWSYREGFQDFDNGPGGATLPGGFSAIDPIHDYPRSLGRSVTGGLVYRGANYPELTGDYLFADYVSGRIWAMDDPGGAGQSVTEIANDNQIAGFGINPSSGDILLADDNSNRVNDDVIKRLVRTEGGGAQPPSLLSETGFFQDLGSLAPAAGVVPYEVNVPFWSDHAEKTRWFAMPDDGAAMTWAEEGAWTFPAGQVWVKHFDLDLNRDAPGTSVRRLETRFLVKTTDDVYGLTYRWNDAQADAELVDADGLEEDFTVIEGGQSRTQTWKYPSRADCRTCHNPTAGFALGFDTRQLNRDFDRGAGSPNQLAWLEAAGYLSNAPSAPETLEKHHRASDESVSLETRVRSYLAVNCVQCHQPGGLALGDWDARPWLTLEETGIVDGPVVNNGGDTDLRFVAPGDPGKSMLLKRLEAMETPNGFSPMPPVGSCEPNAEAIDLLTEWILEELGTGLPAPENVTASDGTDASGIAIAWSPVNGTNEGHTVYRGTTNDFSAATPIAAGVVGGSHSDTTATLGVTYYYWVTASRNGEESPPGGPDTGFLALTAPANFAATDVPTGVELDWDTVVGGESYEIRRGFFDNVALTVPLATVTEESHLDESAEVSRTYHYFVRVRAGALSGPWSESVTIRRLLPAPENLAATDDDFEKVTLTWTPVNGATAHFVFRANSSDRQDAVLLGQAPEGIFEDTSAGIGTAHHYWVSGFGGATGVGHEAGPIMGRRFGGVRVPVTYPPTSANPPETVPRGAPDPGLRAAFHGLLVDIGDARRILGSARVVAFGERLTLVLELNGERFVGRGIFLDMGGAATWDFTDESGQAWSLDLALVDSAEGPRMEGALGRAGTPFAFLTAGANPHHARFQPLNGAGNFTLLLGHTTGGDAAAEPGGDSVGFGFVSPAGRYRFVWRLADGVTVATAGQVDADGQLPIFSHPYGRGAQSGQLAGWLTLRDLPGVSDLDGVLHWKRGAGFSVGGFYGDGFELEVDAIGNRFERPRPGLPLLTQLPDSAPNAVWSLTGGGLASPPGNRWLTWDTRDRITDGGNTAEGSVFLQVNGRNGLVTGFFQREDEEDGRLLATGVMLQAQGKVSGWFRGNGESGLFAIEPSGFPELRVTDSAGNAVTSGAELDFGAIGIDGGMGERWIEIENGGVGRLLLTEAPFVADPAAGFSVVATRAGILDPGERTRIRLRYDPSAFGPASGVLRVPSSDPERAAFFLELTGSGVEGNESSVEAGPGSASPVSLPDYSSDSYSPKGVFDQGSDVGGYAGALNGPSGDSGWGTVFLRENRRDPGTGLFSARLVIGGRVGIVSGSITGEGAFTVERTRGPMFRGFEGVFLAMAENPEGEPGIAGALFRAGKPEVEFVLRARLNVARDGFPAGVLPGRTNVALPMSDFFGSGYPAGDGIGMLVLRPRGNWHLVLKLADGQRRSLGGWLSSDGSLDLHSSWGLGELVGHGRFRETAGVGNLEGMIAWTRRARPAQTWYPEGFRVELPMVGNAYEPPAPDERALPGLTDGAENALVFGSEAALGFPVDWEYSVEWSVRNRLLPGDGALAPGESLRLFLNPRTGWLRGRLVQRPGPRSPRFVDFEGVIFPEQELVTGAWSDRGGRQGRFGVEAEP